MMPWQIFLPDSVNNTYRVWDDPVLFCYGGYNMERLERLGQFEKMYAYIRQNHQETVEQLEKLRGENRQKTATFRQLTARKMKYEDMLALYELFGIQ